MTNTIITTNKDYTSDCDGTEKLKAQSRMQVTVSLINCISKVLEASTSKKSSRQQGIKLRDDIYTSDFRHKTSSTKEH